MESILPIVIVSAFIAAAAGLLGSFALLRRMALVGDALSHVALPGIALGILFNFNLFLGALVFLVLGIVMIWLVEHKTNLPVDTIVGIFFSIALAAGAMILPEEEIERALFGNIMTIQGFDLWLAMIISFVCIVTLTYFYKKFTLTMISRDLSSSAGFKSSYFEFLFLLVFALVVAVGINFAGALLMGPLIVIPAAISRNLAGSMKSYMLWSSLIGVLGAVLAVYVSSVYQLETGPVFVFIAGLAFLISVFISRK